MNMSDLRKIERKVMFQDILTIKGLQEITGLSYNTIMMQILRGALLAEKRDALENQRGGVWLISRQSAMSLWPDKFSSEEHS